MSKLTLRVLCQIGFILSSIYLIMMLAAAFLFNNSISIINVMITITFMLTCILEIKKD